VSAVPMELGREPVQTPLGSTRSLLWVNHFAVTRDMGGGTRHLELGRELVRRGWRVTIAASDFHLHQRRFTRRKSAEDRAPVEEVVDGVTFTWLWAAPYEKNDFRRVRNWWTFSRSLLKWYAASPPPTVVIGSTPHLFAAFSSLRVARRLRVPFLLEVRDLWPESLAVSGRRPGPFYYALAALANHLYQRADRIIVLARGAGDYLEARGVPRARLRYIPNGVDVASAPRARLSRADRLRIVYAGAHGPANGLDIVLRAAEILRSDGRITFGLIGDGPAKQDLQVDAARRSLRNVVFHDSMSKEAVGAFLADSDAGLMVLKDIPLFSFGVSPNKLFDYWAAGLPVICNVPGELESWMRESGGGVQTRDGSPGALAAAVRTLADLAPEKRASMGTRAREWVALHHDRPVLAAELERALNDAVAMERR
jgi:glycosyltransferase involved in cell wall biosynthesis